jgi:large subunit ribosomal protein L22
MIGRQSVAKSTQAQKSLNQNKDVSAVISSRASVNEVRITAQKARRVVDLIRGMKADEALAVLKFAPQAAGETVFKLVASAVANAKDIHGVREASDLWITRAYVDEGTTLKRFRPRAQGRAFKIRKRTSHITVVVSDAKGGSR